MFHKLENHTLFGGWGKKNHSHLIGGVTVVMVIDELGMIHDSPRSTVSQAEESDLQEALALSLSLAPLTDDESPAAEAKATPKPRPPMRPLYDIPLIRPPPRLATRDSPALNPVNRAPGPIPFLRRPPHEPRPIPPVVVPSKAALRAARRHWSPPRERLCHFPAVTAGYGAPSRRQLMNFRIAQVAPDFVQDTDEDSHEDDALSTASTATSVHQEEEE